MVNLFFYVLCFFSITACSTASLSFHSNATAKGLSFEPIQGSSFRHVIYGNKVTTRQDHKTLNVYIGSDGSPWFEHRYITNDPTPLHPVLIDFVRRDKQPAIYLGRPCYHQLGKIQKNCTEDVWTSGRYSSRVVESMVQALQSYLVKHQYKNVQLIGYSGGGSLAMLMAPRIKQVRTVITLAGNLNTDEWTSYHRYLPLTKSLNSSKQATLPKRIKQVHFIGDQDSNIPPSMLTRALINQKNAKVIILENSDHSCCWHKYFNQIMAELTLP